MVTQLPFKALRSQVSLYESSYPEGYPEQEVITYDGQTTDEEMEEYFDGFYVVN